MNYLEIQKIALPDINQLKYYCIRLRKNAIIHQIRRSCLNVSPILSPQLTLIIILFHSSFR